MNVEIIDDFLDEEEFKYMEFMIMGDKFPWYYSSAINLNPDLAEEPKYDYQLFNTLYAAPTHVSDQFKLINAVIARINPRILLRAKINFAPANDRIIEQGMHQDVQVGEDLLDICTTAVLYFNTNNGYTKFENGETVSSIRNRFVSFPSKTFHTGSTCTDQKCRVVLNLNYIK
jgi:hypothetical protein